MTAASSYIAERSNGQQLAMYTPAAAQRAVSDGELPRAFVGTLQCEIKETRKALLHFFVCVMLA